MNATMQEQHMSLEMDAMALCLLVGAMILIWLQGPTGNCQQHLLLLVPFMKLMPLMLLYGIPSLDPALAFWQFR